MKTEKKGLNLKSNKRKMNGRCQEEKSKISSYEFEMSEPNSFMLC